MCPSTRGGIAPLALVALLAVAGGAAAEPCKLGQLAELPVTVQNLQPLVHASINGVDAVFIADSGAYFSMLTPAAARQFNLRLDPGSEYGVGVVGVGGEAQTWVTHVKTFTILKIEVKDVPFIVAGNDLGDAVGLLGQNLFQVGDVEYDLANGVIRLMRPHGDCRKTAFAYWAAAKGVPYSQIDIDSASRLEPHTRGTAFLNGSKIRVMFDTGSPSSLLTLDAAKRAGVTPESPGVTPAGTTYGIGRHRVRTWIAPFSSFRIGDEEVRNTRLRLGDERELGADMLIGADFFLSHHIYVATSQRRLYFTYNGGPVFNLTTQPTASSGTPQPPGSVAGDEAPAAAPGPAAVPSGSASVQPTEQLDAAGYARRGSASAARHDYQHALADLTRAIETAPTPQPDYYYQRAMVYWSDAQPDKALVDLDQAIQLRPGDIDALLARATLHGRQHADPQTISADLDAVDRAAPREAAVRLRLGEMYQSVRNYTAAIAQYDRWIDSHDHGDIQMGRARNLRCWARALTGRELEQALDDCNAAVRTDRKNASFLDSRGLVYLRQGRYDKAIADYDAGLALNPRIAWSLYGRGLAKQHLGQTAAAETDIAAAQALNPKIAEEAASHGIVP